MAWGTQWLMLLRALGNMFIDFDFSLGIASVPSLEKAFISMCLSSTDGSTTVEVLRHTVRSGGVALLLVCFEIKFQVARVSPKLTMEF